ncbi:hypothetical protein B0H19DRAFT_1261457 [Mycena capillaripes]|nr:hypothetical protein B0H19DRAFT_1261457 [Mycena capillaripes]
MFAESLGGHLGSPIPDPETCGRWATLHKLEYSSRCYNAEETLAIACTDQLSKASEILQFSLGSDSAELGPPGHDIQVGAKILNLIPYQNGFVATLLDAYTKDRALVIRPDDVWLVILSQLNFFVNAHAELLRANFVEHDGTRSLRIVAAPANRYTVDFDELACQMTGLAEKNVVNPELRLGGTQFQRHYRRCRASHGDTQEILQRTDWVAILGRLEKLKEYGLETTAWYHLLRPASWRRSMTRKRREHRILAAHRAIQPEGSGRGEYTGWITAFMAFSKEGRCIHVGNTSWRCTSRALSAAEFWVTYANRQQYLDQDLGLVLDDTSYHHISRRAVPSGYCEVDLALDDDGEEVDCSLVAGAVGMRVSSSGDRGLSASGADDTARQGGGKDGGARFVSLGQITINKFSSLHKNLNITMSHISFVNLTHPDAEKISQKNKDVAPSRDQIRSTVRSAFQICSVCKKKSNGSGANAVQLKKCTGCLITRYCSRECQVADWRTHKQTCVDGGSPTHLKLVKRLVANDSLMFSIQLFSILALDLLNNPGNALDSCLCIAVDTNMPADPSAYIQALINGGKKDPTASFVLHIGSLEKQPAASYCTSKTREEHKQMRAGCAAVGIGDWPVVMLVFNNDGSTILEVPYPIDPQAMGEVRERRPFVVHSGLSGTVSVPMTEESIREGLNNFILMDKSNQFLLRTKSNTKS